MKISEVTAFLEGAYDVLNQEYFEGNLPRVVITIQSSPKAFGHYVPWDVWQEQEVGYREINLGAETLNRPIENTIATLIHEMVHHYCAMAGIKETSRGGTYHNKRFKEQAELRGLIIDYDSKIGYSITTPSKSLIEFIEEQGWMGIDLSRASLQGKPKGKRGNVRKYLCPSCGCSVRATKEVNIACMDCSELMLLQ